MAPVEYGISPNLGVNSSPNPDIDGCSSIFITSPFHESARQKIGRSRKYKSSWLSFLIENDTMLIKTFTTSFTSYLIFAFGTASGCTNVFAIAWCHFKILFLGNYKLQSYHNIDLNSFRNYKQHQ